MLHREDPEVHAYFLGRLMRQAKPDDVLSFISLTEILGLWPKIRKMPYASPEPRGAVLKSNMDRGVAASYDRLAELLVPTLERK